MERKKIKSSRYLSAFALTIIIFLLGFIISNFVNEAKMQKIYDLENEIRVESLGNELVYNLISSDLCANTNLTSYTVELSDLGKKLTYMESIYGFESPKVMNIKNYYSLLLVRHWLINTNANSICNISKPNVLFFYTNYLDCGDCEDQGLVLTYVHDKYPFFNVYSFEYQLDNPAMNFLKEKYNLNSARLPTLIIDDEVYYGFRNKDFLIDKLNLIEKSNADI